MLWALDETALDLFARRPVRGFLTGLSFLDAPAGRTQRTSAGSSKPSAKSSDGYHPRQVVELCGAADTPKMEILLHVVAAFLTRSMDGSDDQHATERVFLFDHEYEASAPRLLELVASRLKTKASDDDDTPEAAAERWKTVAQQAMERVMVCHCRDTFHWLATLNHIHFQLLEAASARKRSRLESNGCSRLAIMRQLRSNACLGCDSDAAGI
ncbi:hypothetical protein BBJ28_00012284 [Nothophytophthora sp. Chile5]|nr:hypothetical protein BBJ28_00012284 [Nothophytophthora sp. Chile5]